MSLSLRIDYAGENEIPIFRVEYAVFPGDTIIIKPKPDLGDTGLTDCGKKRVNEMITCILVTVDEL